MTITGKPLVQGDTAIPLRFSDLGLDWQGEGYTLKLKTVNPNGTATIDDLIAVAGDTEAADLQDRTNLCAVAGYARIKILVYENGSYLYSGGYSSVNIQEQ